MDRRFSTFTMEPLLAAGKPIVSQPISSMASTIPAASQIKKQSRFKLILKAILPGSSTQKPSHRPEELDDHLWSTVVYSSTKPLAPPKKKTQIQKKDGPKTGAVIVLSPRPTQLPGFRRRDIFSKNLRGEGGRDSKFSSISSLASLQPKLSFGPSSTSIKLSIFDYERLRSLTRRLRRGLMKQEWLSGTLSNNVVQLLGRKEKQISQIRDIRRLRREDRDTMVRVIFMAKEQAGRIFLRKAVLLQHSQGVLAQLREMLELNVSPVGDGFIEMHISPETIYDFFTTLQADLTLQAQLDEDLLNMVKKGCADRRFSSNINDKIITDHFMQFVGERVAVLKACYERTGTIVKQICALHQDLGALTVAS
jgi:hypothetical protein